MNYTLCVPHFCVNFEKYETKKTTIMGYWYLKTRGWAVGPCEAEEVGGGGGMSVEF